MTQNDYFIPFNKPYMSGNELNYIQQAVVSGKISGNGFYTKKCQSFFETRYKFGKTLMTSSCTDALEMCAILADLKPGDEVIMPAYTFVSTANAFALQKAKPVFVDSYDHQPNMNADLIVAAITPKTKAIVAMHYGGVSCDMKKISDLCQKHKLLLIEDAAHSIESFYNSKPLGSIGRLSTFSFHETKNIIAGEGGLLAVNDPELFDRAEFIWEKGTNRSAFWRGTVNKYDWIDVGSSFLCSEVTAAFLLSQLDSLEQIQKRRVEIWNYYNNNLQALKSKGIGLPVVPEYASTNGHLFYLITKSKTERDSLIAYLKERGISAVFHYLPLNESPYYVKTYGGYFLKNARMFSEQLVRLPLFFELTDSQLSYICSCLFDFYKNN